MKKYLCRIIPVFIILFIFLYSPAGVVTNLHANQTNGYLENILFEQLSGRERISLVVSAQPLNIAPPSMQADNSLLIKLEDMIVPENMRETLGRGNLLNVTDVKADQRTIIGKQWIYLKIHLKENVPYAIRQEGNLIVIDFNISSLEKQVTADARKGAFKTSEAPTDSASNKAKEIERKSMGRMVSVDFQDADIKSVLRLMAEYGDVSIISGDDVKGNITLSIKNVPWDQALDSILDVKGLAKKQMGDVISVMTLDKKKRDAAEKKATEEADRKAEEDRKAREQKDDIEKGKLRQIMIEAKIVEASEEFVRNLGIQWGGGQTTNINGAYGLGVSGGTNPLNQMRTNNYAFPAEISSTMTMAAVNMPASVVGPTLGLVFGGAHGFIETQLAALEKTTQGKIISAPKIVTMDNVKAIIKQGEEVPYVTPASASAPPTVSFKDAVLRLEVTPKITDDDRISMDIKATNDRADYSRANAAGENPPIVKNEMESKVVVQDGDTVVIGGVSKTDETTITAGVPWFYKIPVLGWLFKTENIKNQKRQLLIFITPKILSESGYIENECDNVNLDRCRKRK